MDCEKNGTYEGTLETYYETGFEGQTALILYVDAPGALTPNQHHDPKNPSSGPAHFKSLSYAVFLHKTDVIELLDGTNRIIKLGKDVKAMKMASADKFRISVYPENMELEEFKKLFASESVRARVIRTRFTS